MARAAHAQAGLGLFLQHPVLVRVVGEVGGMGLPRCVLLKVGWCLVGVGLCGASSLCWHQALSACTSGVHWHALPIPLPGLDG